MATPVSFEVEKRNFVLDGSWPPRFSSWPEGCAPLCRVVETAFRYDAAKFFSSILARTGQSFEGEVSFAFHEQYPDEIPEGASFNYLGEEQQMSESLLDEFVARFALAMTLVAARARVELPAQVLSLVAVLEQNVK